MSFKSVFYIGILLIIRVVSAESRTPILLKSAAPNGEGPLALPYLRNTVAGSAYVFGSEQADLFVMGNGKTNGLYLFKWLRNNSKGVPVFDIPIKIKKFSYPKAYIFQTKDKCIHALWTHNSWVMHAIFNLDSLSFFIKEKVQIKGLDSHPISVSAFEKEEGGVDLILEVVKLRKTAKYEHQNPSTKEWRPYDEAGIASTSVNYASLYVLRFPSLLKGEHTFPILLTTENKEALVSIINSTPIRLCRDKPKGLITGSRQGIFYYYDELPHSFLDFPQVGYVVDENGNIFRHPSISASVCAYPESKSGLTHLISGGEGAVYFYRFSGKFSKTGNPIFEDPTPVLQENADLYAGTLPVPSSADWDGDGIIDLIVGNSEGFVLFFKNIGDNIRPAFLPGEPILVGGRAIQIQAGYSGSIQGVNEARWGYASPTIFDWTGDGLPDIIMGDITGNYTIFINKGVKSNPKFEKAEALYCDGLELHGMWRSRAAVGKLRERMALVIVDGEDCFHLYWKIDDYNVEDGGKLKLNNGSLIKTSAEPAGGTGRCKLSFFDYDSDGLLDLIIGTGRRSAIPNMEVGYPLPVLGKKTLGTPLFMKNVSADKRLVFNPPQPFDYFGIGIVQPGGSHESGAIGTSLGGGNKCNLIIGNETGRLFLLQGEQMKLMNIDEAARYLNTPNPLFDKINYKYHK